MHGLLGLLCRLVKRFEAPAILWRHFLGLLLDFLGFLGLVISRIHQRAGFLLGLPSLLLRLVGLILLLAHDVVVVGVCLLELLVGLFDGLLFGTFLRPGRL